MERRLLEIVESRRLVNGSDLLDFCPDDLPPVFTTQTLSGALRQSRALAQQFAYCLRHSGTAEICGKQGNALEYRLALDNAPILND